jgi:TonB-linked SusC/RagA family outer membrane protein
MRKLIRWALHRVPRRISFVMLMACPFTLLLGQAGTGTIRGRVTDATSGIGVAEADIRIQGTTRHVLTSADGRYVLRGLAPGKIVVQLLSIGFKPQARSLDLAANAEVTIDWVFQRSVVTLDEVVTTATGSQARREIPNVVATIRVDSLAKLSPVVTLDQVLQARVPGVNLTPGYGMTGGSATIRIRGINSMSLSNDPLWIIDGIRLESRGFDASSNITGNNQGLASIRPEDIESMDVIKGPSATAIYGTQASAGVIVIKTKRGRAGKTTWNLYAEEGKVQQPALWPDNYRSWGRARNATTGVVSTAVSQCRISNSVAGTCVIDSLTTFNPLRNKETTPFGQMGDRQNLGLQVQGGSETLRYFASMEHETEIGPYTMPDSEIKRLTAVNGYVPRGNQIHPNRLDQYNLRANFTADVRPDLNMNVSTVFTNRNLQTPFNASYFQGIQTQALTAPGYRTQYNGYSNQNLGDMMSLEQPTNENRFMLATTTNYNPLHWLSARLTAGTDRSFGNSIMFARYGEGPQGGWGTNLTGQGGGKYVSRDNYGRNTMDLLMTASYSPMAGLTTKSSVGAQYNTDSYVWSVVEGYMLAPGATSITSGGTKLPSEGRSYGKQEGLYFDEAASWQDKVFVTGGVRTDKSSAFGQGYPRVLYPRLGVSWVVSQEKFFPKIPVLTDLRLRTAWGRSGIQPGPTTALQQLSASSVVINGQASPTLRLSSLGNLNIKPEVVSEIEGGLEAGLWNRRIAIEATYYSKMSKDGINSIPLPPSLGAATTQTVNIARVKNAGFEYAIDAAVLQQRLVSWNLRLSGSRTVNKIVDMGTLPQNNATNTNKVGYPINGFWQRRITGFADANGDGIIAATEVTVDTAWTYIGPTLPTSDAALTSTLGFFQDKLQVTAMFDHRGGNYRYWSAERDRCTNGNCYAVNDPRAPLADQAAAVVVNSTAYFNSLDGYIKKADFTRLRELAITYRLPKMLTSRSGAKGGTLVISGRNLWITTKYPGLDPEAGASTTAENNWTPPPLRYFISRINLTF